MKRHTRSFRYLALATAIATMLGATAPLPAIAGLVSTDQALATLSGDTDRATILSFLARQDIRAQMIELGVTPDEAATRVASLSDGELQNIAGRIDQVPAGEGLGILVAGAGLIFIILLITDIIGVTNVFTFVR
ncbi:MAG: PA2779 family protein [Alphaproteobacteria bacterium]